MRLTAFAIMLIGCDGPRAAVAPPIEAGPAVDSSVTVPTSRPLLEVCNEICDDRDRIRELKLLRDELEADIARLQRPTVRGTRYINDAGYPVTAFLLPDGGTRIVFVGPPFDGPP